MEGLLLADLVEKRLQARGCQLFNDETAPSAFLGAIKGCVKYIPILQNKRVSEERYI